MDTVALSVSVIEEFKVDRWICRIQEITGGRFLYSYQVESFRGNPEGSSGPCNSREEARQLIARILERKGLSIPRIQGSIFR